MKVEISKKRQLEAMATGSFLSLVAEFVPDPTVVDIRKYVSVSRDELRGYLREHPFVAKSILGRARCDSASHDRFCVEVANGKYHLFWLDHGNKRFGEEFDSIEEAVAAYVMKEHGLA